MHSFIQNFTEHLLNTYYVLGPVQIGDVREGRCPRDKRMAPAFKELTVNWGDVSPRNNISQGRASDRLGPGIWTGKGVQKACILPCLKAACDWHCGRVLALGVGGREAQYQLTPAISGNLQ